jgi:putative endonuclease
MPAYCYLLLCADGSYYCGWTYDVDQRLAAHQSGKGSRYTRAHLPLKLAYVEVCGDRTHAQRREKEIKSLSHAEKEQLTKDGSDHG